VGTTRRVITSTWPGDTGNESKIAKARAFAHSHSASGMAEKGEGDGDPASGRMATVYEPPGQRWSGVESGRERALTQKVNACIFLGTRGTLP
jgi:hypothetical protein